MPRLNIETVTGASDRAWSNKQQYDELLRECYEHALPGRNPYHANGTGRPQGISGQQGQDKSSRRVYDSTLQNDAIKLANRIQYELFPIGYEWAELQPGAFVGNDVKQRATTELHSLQKVIFTAISLSNFDLSIAEWLLELVVAGMAVMFVIEGDEDNPIVYQTVPQSHVAVREGALGKIDLISRVHKMRISLVKETWTDAKINATEKEREEDKEIDLVDVCYWSARDRTWYYEVIVTKGLNGGKASRIVEREYDVNPWIISRWNKATGEVQGRSIVMQALPDARVLSAVKSHLLRHAALAIGGVFMVRNDGTMNANNVRIFPGATIPVKATGGPSPSIAPLPVSGDINLADLVIRDLVGSIHQTMMNDGMPEISEGVRTATELLERLKELQQSLGAPFARILKEGIIPMLEATIAILGKIGVIPVEEGQKIKLNNGQIKVKFSSPLVQGQSIREVEALQHAAAVTKEIGGEQAVGLNFKVEDAGAWIGASLGVVPDMMRSKEERDKLQQQAGQLAAQQAMPEVGGEGGVNPAEVQAANAGQAPLAA